MQPVFIPKSTRLYRETVLGTLLPGYRSHVLALPRSLREVMRLGVLSADRRYMFIRNSKAACTTGMQAVHFWETGQEAGRDVHSSPRLIVGRRHYDVIAEALVDPEVFRFTFVRHPARRVVSAFTNFFLDASHHQRHPHIRRLKRLGFREDATAEHKFDCFLDYVAACLKEDPLRTDSHFRPQYFNIRPDVLDYGHIGRVEALDAELSRIGAALGLPPLPEGKMAQHNASRGGFVPNGWQRAAIERIYAVDYQSFGYDGDADLRRAALS